MRPRSAPARVLPAQLLAMLLATFLVRPAAAAWPTSPYAALTVCGATGDQLTPVITADGSGGEYVAWIDNRVSNLDLYLTHVVNGAVAPGWPADGMAVCTGQAGTRTGLSLVAGAAGDVFVAWTDSRAGNTDSYIQRVLPNATIAGGWPVNGLGIAIDARNQNQVRTCSDAAGGVYLVWTLEFTPGSDYDIYATRVLPNGTIAAGFGPTGLAINGASLRQQLPDICADGAGNAIIGYENVDGSNVGLIWGQKLGPAGARSWGSPSLGILISQFGNNQRNVRVTSDGAGGALFAADLSLGGSNESETWFANPDGSVRGGVGFYQNGTGYQYLQSAVSDNKGGAWYVSGATGAPWDYALFHVDPAGVVSPNATPGFYLGSNQTTLGPLAGLVGQVDGSVLVASLNLPATGHSIVGQAYDLALKPLWNGGSSVMLENSLYQKNNMSVAADGSGGAVLAWSEYRPAGADIQVTRVDRFGALGDAAPHIARISDVPNDQGGAVSVQWTPSYLDASPDFPIARYSMWRRVPGDVAAQSRAHGVTLLGERQARPADANRVVRAEPSAAGTIYWEYLSQTPARGYGGYNAVAPTTSDSLPGANPRTWFRVEAETASGVPYWDSPADSGYSVDNLAPPTPAPFTGVYAAGSATLTWGADTVADLSTYRLYRGTSPGFTPSPLNLLKTLPNTGYVDPAGVPYVYKLTAVDVHGNESLPATVIPAGALGVGDAPVHALAFAPPSPNPASRAATLRFTLARAGVARVTILDTAGRVVRDFALGDLGAGDHAVAWDLADGNGRAAAAGLYFARLETAGRSSQQRIVVTR